MSGLWWGLTAALGLVLLHVWHLILFKQALDQPTLVGGWILACWLLGTAAAAVERWPRPSGAGGWVPRLFSGHDRTFLLLLAVFSVLILLFHVGFMRAASDGRGYFAQTRSIVIDHDLDFANDIAAFRAREQDAGFPLGTAILWSPFLLLAHGWLGLLNLLGADHVRDGFSNPYQRAVGLGTFLYGAAAFMMALSALRRYFDRSTALTAVFAILLATPTVWYLAVDSSMSHGVSLFAATLFLLAWLSGRGRRTWRDVALLALATILMTAVRPQNLLFLGVLVPELAMVLRRQWQTGSRPRLIGRATAGLVGGTLAAMVALQVLPDFAALPSVTYFVRQGLFQEWSLLQQLFSPHHGLISSSPVLLFAFAGLLPLYRRDRSLVISLWIVLAAQILVTGTSAGWSGGSSFGARRFISCALPFAFGLAGAIDLARRRPLVPVTLLLGGLAAVNLALVDEARRGSLTLSDAVPFTRMIDSLSSRTGNPFALPGSAYLAWRWDVPLAFLDRLPARKFAQLRIDVGREQDEQFLVGAWLDRERDGGGAFRWTSGQEVGLFAWLRAPAYQLRFTAEPFVYPGAPQQTVEVRAGDISIGTVELARGRASYEIDIPTGAIHEGGWLRLYFQFAYAAAPETVLESADARMLAVRFDVIELLPR